jgi:hypothetical protein
MGSKGSMHGRQLVLQRTWDHRRLRHDDFVFWRRRIWYNFIILHHFLCFIILTCGGVQLRVPFVGVFISGELYFLSTSYTDTERRRGAVYQLFDPERYWLISLCAGQADTSLICSILSCPENNQRPGIC